MFKSISVVGGDLRQITLAKLMAAEGYDVVIYGFKDDASIEGVHSVTDMNEALYSDVIILPVPVTFDNETLNTPYSDKGIPMCDLLDSINPASVVFGGRITAKLSAELEMRGIKYSDYMTRDELAIRNAIPTAEGAVKIAISETPFTLHGSKCLVMGYGKVGKILSNRLNGMGANTYVEARKYADLALIESHSCVPLTLKETKTRIAEFDIIFNTVPALILDKTALERARKDTLIIDLASRPGGVDFETARELGLNVIWALSLPGRVAPVTAGIIIKDTIKNILDDMQI